MMNYKVSFTACNFSEADLVDWLAWLQTNIEVKELEVKPQEDNHASDAKDHPSPAQRVNPKRVGR
jgi:hypothetical protein